jgi:DNA-directed RNA polymerase specialized sigma24 family protein
MLQESWPLFLDYLDSDPFKAAEGFCTFAVKFFRGINPRFLLAFDSEEQKDVMQEICLHCIDHDFRILRQYQPGGRGFGSWFYVIAHNKAMDLLRRRGRYSKIVSQNVLNEKRGNGEKIDLLPSPHTILITKDRLRIVQSLITGMDRYCQLLIKMGSDELTPLEMTRVLRWQPHKARKISDDLRYCREKLRKMMNQQGVDAVKSL